MRERLKRAILCSGLVVALGTGAGFCAGSILDMIDSGYPTTTSKPAQTTRPVSNLGNYNRSNPINNVTGQQQSNNSNRNYTNNSPAVNVNEIPEVKDYMSKLMVDARKYWRPVRLNRAARTVLLFNLYRTGKIGHVSVLESSGDGNFDASAITALKQAAPFEPYPSVIGKDSIEIRINYDYNAQAANQNPSYTPTQNDYEAMLQAQAQAYAQAQAAAAQPSVNLRGDLTVSSGAAMVEYDGYRFLNALSQNYITQIAYLYFYKLDCAKKQLGYKRVYLGDPNSSINLSPSVVPYLDPVKMHNPSNSDEKLIFRYACGGK